MLVALLLIWFTVQDSALCVHFTGMDFAMTGEYEVSHRVLFVGKPCKYSKSGWSLLFGWDVKLFLMFRDVLAVLFTCA